MSHKYSRSKQHRSYLNGPIQHGYNPSIHPETFELDKFASELLAKECDGNLLQCESLKRLGIILNKYRLFVIQQNNAMHTHTQSNHLNSNRLGLVGVNSGHEPFHSMSITPQMGHTISRSADHQKERGNLDMLAMYQQQIYGNPQPMMNLNKTSSMYDFINFKLGNEYNNTALLNDFHHLLYQHCDKDKQYQQIYNYLVQHIGTKCAPSMCKILCLRNGNELDMFKEEDTIQEIITRQTINKMHCYFLHSYDIGYRFNDKEYKTLNQYDYEHQTDESDGEDDGGSVNMQSIDEKLSIVCKMINKKHSYITRQNKKQNSYSKQRNNVFDNLCKNYGKYSSYMNVIEKCKKFYYWDCHKTWMEIDNCNGGFISDWYVMRKYKDLKQELLQNKLCNLQKIHFEYLWEKTKEIMTTNKVKRIKANNYYGNTRLLRQYNIDKRSPITANHILTLLIYCNHTPLQLAFIQSFHANSDDYSSKRIWDDIIVRHSQLAHFSKYLRECCEIYGASMRSSDKFYHTIHGQYLFTDSILNLYSPISCTNSLYVSCNINKYNCSAQCNDNGLILQFSKYLSSSASYFDMKWMSEWCNESEKLCFSSSGPLRIVNILDTIHSRNYQQFISGLNYLNSILHGDKEEESPSKYGKTAMALLMQNEALKKKQSKRHNSYYEKSHVPLYIEKVFSNYCNKKSKLIEIDIDMINDRYYSVKKHIMSNDDSWVDMSLLCTLFPNVLQIVIKDGPYLTDYTFKRLVSFMETHSRESNQSKLTKIVFRYPKEEGIGVEEGIKKYYDAIKYRNWDTFYYQSPTNDLITMYFVKAAAIVANEVDHFAFELWQQLTRISVKLPDLNDFPITREIGGNYLFQHIQQYFPNRFPSDDDVLSIINDLVTHQYLLLIYDLEVNANITNVLINNFDQNKAQFRYQFELDKYREFVKKSEGNFRKKWTIGSDVRIFSSHHSQWKLAKVVKEIGDILIVSFKSNDKTYNKTVDRYQKNIIVESHSNQIAKRDRINNSFIKRKPSVNGATAMSYYYNANNNGQRWSQYYGSSNNGHSSIPSNNYDFRKSSTLMGPGSANSSMINYPSTTASATPTTYLGGARASSRVSFGAVLKRPNLATNDSNALFGIGTHEIYESNSTISLLTPRTSAFQRQSRRTTRDSFQPEFAPCKGDPFWDYYRTIGDISRANCAELIKVMRWISAEDIMRQLLMNWLHKKIEPIELPFANVVDDVFESNFNLHATSVIAFVRQSLNSKQHPSCFDLPELTRYYEISPHVNHRHEEQLSVSMSGSTENRGANDDTNQPLNIVGQKILSFLDQTSFLNACLVSRAWLYCSRSSRSRSHIKFRLWNALKFLIKDSDLMLIITGNNDIVSITKFMRDRNDIKDDANEDNYSDTDDIKSGNIDSDTNKNDDVLINYAAGNDHKTCLNRRNNKNGPKFLRKRSTTHDSKNSFPHFFSTRINCSLFENITQLQFDFNIPSHNKLIYYINQSLVDSYWDTLSVLFGIETLQKLDILFPDPHILLVAYILQNSLSYSKTSKRIMFPQIGVPKSKFVCAAKHLHSIRFAVKSLTLSKLEEMLNIHFEHYYHPIHHKNQYKYHALDDSEYAQYVYGQSNKKMFTKLDIYRLCHKIIHKSLIFDISNALYSLNHPSNTNNRLTSLAELSLCDVKCLGLELSIFLNNNGANLKSIDLMFTQKCLCPKYISHSKPNLSANVTPSGVPSMSRNASTYSSLNINAQFGQVSNSISHSHTHQPSMYSDSDDSRYHHSALPNTQSHNAHKQAKNHTRAKKTVTELFGGILKYLKKQTSAIHEHNHRIKKKFKLAKNSSNNNQIDRPKLQITYANKLRGLALESLSFSFPIDIDLSILEGYCALCNFFTVNECSEISLKNLYLDGGCLTPFTYSNNNKMSMKWANFMQSQIGNIEVLCMKRVLYSSLMFYENFCNSKTFVSMLTKIDLQIIYSDEFDDPYLHNLEVRQPIHELLHALRQCQCLEILYLDFIQHHSNPNDIITHSSLIPELDIYEIDCFMKSKYIKKSIHKLHLTFNELSTIRFEQKMRGSNSFPSKYIRRNHLNLGSILRINSAFKDKIEEVIMSWFGECIQLKEIRLLRHIHSNHDHAEFETYIEHINNQNQSNRYKFDKNVDFQNRLPFQKKAKLIIDQTDHSLAFYGVSKRKKVGDFYRGEVFGELAKILQPQNPVE